MGAIEGGAGNGHAHDGCLNDSVLLGVKGAAKFMAFAAFKAHLLAGAAAQFVAVLHACRRTVVAGGDDAMVLD